MSNAPFGKNLESACRAGFHRDLILLTQAADRAADALLAMVAGTPEYQTALALWVAVENAIYELRDRMPR